jgi:transcriptional antiterminator RfaH
MFMFGTTADRLRALKTNRISQIIAVDDGKQLCQDLQAVQRLIDNGTPLTIESRLEPDQRVRIRAGALQGLEGTVVRRKNATRIVVWVKMLQQGVSMDIEDYLLDPIE